MKSGGGQSRHPHQRQHSPRNVSPSAPYWGSKVQRVAVRMLPPTLSISLRSSSRAPLRIKTLLSLILSPFGSFGSLVQSKFVQNPVNDRPDMGMVRMAWVLN